jgi:hypothetical protein
VRDREQHFHRRAHAKAGSVIWSNELASLVLMTAAWLCADSEIKTLSLFVAIVLTVRNVRMRLCIPGCVRNSMRRAEQRRRR